jgi:membrane protein implicated in regulation of membrane protease activity
MIEYLNHLSAWDWLALATALLILEVFGAGGYLLWSGLAAASLGVLAYAYPELPWQWQLCLFALLTSLSALLWRKRQRNANGLSDR